MMRWLAAGIYLLATLVLAVGDLALQWLNIDARIATFAAPTALSGSLVTGLLGRRAQGRAGEVMAVWFILALTRFYVFIAGINPAPVVAARLLGVALTVLVASRIANDERIWLPGTR